MVQREITSCLNVVCSIVKCGPFFPKRNNEMVYNQQIVPSDYWYKHSWPLISVKVCVEAISTAF